MDVKRTKGPTPADETRDGALPGGEPGAEPATPTTSDAASARPQGDPALEAGAGLGDDDAGDSKADAALPDGQVPIQAQQLIDPRAIARASLEASRNASLWWTSAGVLVATVVAVTVGTRAGAYTLAALLAVCAVVRAVLPHPGPVAVSVRAKVIDVTVLSVLAVSIGVLAQLLPGRAS